MTDYRNAFIQVSPDCPASEGIIPKSGRVEKTIPELEYELIAERPYQYTHDEILFLVYTKRMKVSTKEPFEPGTKHWDEFFSKSHACMQASMLPKKYGWGLHFDSEGKVGLVAVNSDLYREFQNGKDYVEVFTAMRNKRQHL